jgi:hypothetical protein
MPQLSEKDQLLALLEQLAEAERQIALGGQLIDRQYRFIAELERDGHDTTPAITLMMQLLDGQQTHEQERDGLRKKLAAFQD